jgi:hypothetical protein
MAGMFSFTRWCAAILAMVALTAGSAVVRPATSTGSALAIDLSVISAGNSHTIHVVSPCHKRCARIAPRSDAPLVSRAFITRAETATFDDDSDRAVTAPRGASATDVYDATGPPDALQS